MEKLRKNNGITLIALVITIIVLLILAGVTIVTLTGDNSLIKKANEAKVEINKNSAKEKIELEVLASYSLNGELDPDVLIARLRDNLNINAQKPFPMSVTLDGYNFIITKDGYVEEVTDNNIGVGEPVEEPTVGELKLTADGIELYKDDDFIENVNDAFAYVDSVDQFFPENVFENSELLYDIQNYEIFEYSLFELSNNDEEWNRVVSFNPCIDPEIYQDVQIVVSCDLVGDADVLDWEFCESITATIHDDGAFSFEIPLNIVNKIKSSNRSAIYILAYGE